MSCVEAGRWRCGAPSRALVAPGQLLLFTPRAGRALLPWASGGRGLASVAPHTIPKPWACLLFPFSCWGDWENCSPALGITKVHGKAEAPPDLLRVRKSSAFSGRCFIYERPPASPCPHRFSWASDLCLVLRPCHGSREDEPDIISAQTWVQVPALPPAGYRDSSSGPQFPHLSNGVLKGKFKI